MPRGVYDRSKMKKPEAAPKAEKKVTAPKMPKVEKKAASPKAPKMPTAEKVVKRGKAKSETLPVVADGPSMDCLFCQQKMIESTLIILANLRSAVKDNEKLVERIDADILKALDELAMVSVMAVEEDAPEADVAPVVPTTPPQFFIPPTVSPAV